MSIMVLKRPIPTPEETIRALASAVATDAAYRRVSSEVAQRKLATYRGGSSGGGLGIARLDEGATAPTLQLRDLLKNG
jgi:hypothetical protein